MKQYNGCMKNSKISTDEKGDYVVVSVDADGNEFKVYITSLQK